MRGDVVAQPNVEGRLGKALGGEEVCCVFEAGVRVRLEAGLDAVEFLGRQGARTVLDVFPFRIDLVAEAFRRHGADENLDARLVFVVAAAVAVVHPQDGFEIGEQVLFGQAFADAGADGRRAPQAPADEKVEQRLAVFAGVDLDADVVDVDGGAVRFGAVDGDS